jgi:hypothetical protein
MWIFEIIFPDSHTTNIALHVKRKSKFNFYWINFLCQFSSSFASLKKYLFLTHTHNLFGVLVVRVFFSSPQMILILFLIFISSVVFSLLLNFSIVLLLKLSNELCGWYNKKTIQWLFFIRLFSKREPKNLKERIHTQSDGKSQNQLAKLVEVKVPCLKMHYLFIFILRFLFCSLKSAKFHIEYSAV